jgi:hypothetical protein
MKTLILMTSVLWLGACASIKTSKSELKTVDEVVQKYDRNNTYEQPFTSEQKENQKTDGLQQENARLRTELDKQRQENERLRQHIGLLPEQSGKRLHNHTKEGSPVFVQDSDISTSEELMEKKNQEKKEEKERAKPEVIFAPSVVPKNKPPTSFVPETNPKLIPSTTPLTP